VDKRRVGRVGCRGGGSVGGRDGDIVWDRGGGRCGRGGAEVGTERWGQR
jgi:hypothetical protein